MTNNEAIDKLAEWRKRKLKADRINFLKKKYGKDYKSINGA